MFRTGQGNDNIAKCSLRRRGWQDATSTPTVAQHEFMYVIGNNLLVINVGSFLQHCRRNYVRHRSSTWAAQPIDHAASKEDSALPGLSMICVAGKDKANRCRCGILAFPRYKSYETPIQQPVGWRVGTHTATEHRKIVQDTC